MVLKRAVELARGQAIEVSSGPLAVKLTQYSELLAAQGSLQTAINYLGNSREVIYTYIYIYAVFVSTCTTTNILIKFSFSVASKEWDWTSGETAY